MKGKLTRAQKMTLLSSTASLTQELIVEFNSLDLEDPETANIVVLTSYTTWRRRMFCEPANLAVRRGVSSSEDPVVRLDIATKKDSKEYMLGWPEKSKFQRIILDEGHKVKDSRTNLHKSIAGINRVSTWIVSATPMINRASDLTGLLHLLHWESNCRDFDFRAADDTVSIYEDASSSGLSHLHILHPACFMKPFSRGFIPAYSAMIAIPKILNRIRLRRAVGHTMAVGEKEVTIGKSISPYVVKTIECQFKDTIHPRPIGFPTNKNKINWADVEETRILDVLQFSGNQKGINHDFRWTLLHPQRNMGGHP